MKKKSGNPKSVLTPDDVATPGAPKIPNSQDDFHNKIFLRYETCKRVNHSAAGATQDAKVKQVGVVNERNENGWFPARVHVQMRDSSRVWCAFRVSARPIHGTKLE